MGFRIIHWPTFFITIIITTIILFAFIALRLRLPLDCDFKKKKHYKYAKKARSGDILAVAYGSKRGKLVKVFTGSMWAHVAVVLNESSEEPLVLEVARYSDTERGIMVTDLSSWLSRNKHYLVGYRPYIGNSIDKNKLKNFLSIHEGVKENMFVVDWLKSMYKTKYNTKKELKRKYYCSELVTHFLHEMGIMNKKYGAAGYKPWELLYGDLTLTKKSRYGATKLLDLELCKENNIT